HLKAQSHTPSELFLAVRTALLWKQAEKAHLLFEAGVDPLKENEEKDQLLTHAASGGDPDLVKRMLALGCDPNHQNVHQRTPIYQAARSGHSEAIHILIKAGADPNIRDHRNVTPCLRPSPTTVPMRRSN
ncbi:MAG: ankyrin repeat domain-containing protein, partial [Deltaproteobacteria bacterium]|nr:ankyrin repeat domain-containing protein [Deltaproteobacteria bacterium]